MYSDKPFRTNRCSKGSECPFAKGQVKKDGKIVPCSFKHEPFEISCSKGFDCPFAKGQIKTEEGKTKRCAYWHDKKHILCFKGEQCTHYKQGKCAYYHPSPNEEENTEALNKQLLYIQIEEAKERLEQQRIKTQKLKEGIYEEDEDDSESWAS